MSTKHLSTHTAISNIMPLATTAIKKHIFRYNSSLFSNVHNKYMTGGVVVHHKLPYQVFLHDTKKRKWTTSTVFIERNGDDAKLYHIDNIYQFISILKPIKLHGDFPELIIQKVLARKDELLFIIQIDNMIWAYIYDYEFNLKDKIKITHEKNFLFAYITQSGDYAFNIKDDLYRVIFWNTKKNKMKKIDNAIFYKRIIKVIPGTIPELQSIGYVKINDDRLEVRSYVDDRLLTAYSLLNPVIKMYLDKADILFAEFNYIYGGLTLVHRNGVFFLKQATENTPIFPNGKLPETKMMITNFVAPSQQLMRMLKRTRYSITEKELEVEMAQGDPNVTGADYEHSLKPRSFTFKHNGEKYLMPFPMLSPKEIDHRNEIRLKELIDKDKEYVYIAYLKDLLVGVPTSVVRAKVLFENNKPTLDFTIEQDDHNLDEIINHLETMENNGYVDLQLPALFEEVQHHVFAFYLSIILSKIGFTNFYHKVNDKIIIGDENNPLICISKKETLLNVEEFKKRINQIRKERERV